MSGLFSHSSPRRVVPYGMFDRESYGLAASNARLLERVYHQGQAQAWDGREVLASLIATHGQPRFDERTRAALGRVFGIILWGELAAWRISAELADEIEPIEAKLAATSQAFDEARHFYVMHDYLLAAQALPERLDRGPEILLESIMNADHLAKKLLGMQLMVEPIALTLFHIVRKLRVEPVLTALLPYYERDEARHVALGVQYLPSMLTRMSVAERISFWAYQMQLLTLEVWAQRAVARDLATLGCDPRELIRIGKGKQVKAMNLVLGSLGVEPGAIALVVGRYADVLTELLLVQGDPPPSLFARLKGATRAVMHHVEAEEVELVPDITAAETPLIRGQAGAR